MKIVNLIFPHLENPQSPEVNNDAHIDHISKSVWQYFQLGIGMVEFSNHTRPSY
jgi:VanZ family protein